VVGAKSICAHSAFAGNDIVVVADSCPGGRIAIRLAKQDVRWPEPYVALIADANLLDRVLTYLHSTKVNLELALLALADTPYTNRSASVKEDWGCVVGGIGAHAESSVRSAAQDARRVKAQDIESSDGGGAKNVSPLKSGSVYTSVDP